MIFFRDLKANSGAILQFHDMRLIEYFEVLQLGEGISVIVVYKLKEAEVFRYAHICQKSVKQLLVDLKVAVSHLDHEDSDRELHPHLKLFAAYFALLAAGQTVSYEDGGLRLLILDELQVIPEVLQHIFQVVGN